VDAPRHERDRVVGDREDDELDLLDERRRVHERPDAGDQAPEPLAPSGVAARHGMDRPARPVEGHTERRADRTRADDPDHRRLPGRALDVGVAVGHGVVVRVLTVTPVAAPIRGPGRARRVDVDPGVIELAERLLAGLRRERLFVGRVAPRLHHAGRERESGYSSTYRVYRPVPTEDA